MDAAKGPLSDGDLLSGYGRLQLGRGGGRSIETEADAPSEVTISFREGTGEEAPLASRIRNGLRKGRNVWRLLAASCAAHCRHDLLRNYVPLWNGRDDISQEQSHRPIWCCCWAAPVIII